MGIAGFRDLIGSPFGDNLIGDNNPNIISGGGGNDTILGLAGADSLNGGGGYNTLVQALDANMVLTDTQLTLSGGVLTGTQVVAI